MGSRLDGTQYETKTTNYTTDKSDDDDEDHHQDQEDAGVVIHPYLL